MRCSELSCSSTASRSTGTQRRSDPPPQPSSPPPHSRQRGTSAKHKRRILPTPPDPPQTILHWNWTTRSRKRNGAGPGNGEGGNTIPRSVKLRSQPNLFTPLLSASEGTRPPFENDQTFFLLFFYHVNLWTSTNNLLLTVHIFSSCCKHWLVPPFSFLFFWHLLCSKLLNVTSPSCIPFSF